MAKWRRGEHDDLVWLDWYLEVLRGHAAAGRRCRRARVVSEPISDYQRWTMSHANVFIEAGEDIRYVSRSRLTNVSLPGSGDFYVFDDALVLFLHYAGNGTNASFETTDDVQTVATCRQAFETVWSMASALRDYQHE